MADLKTLQLSFNPGIAATSCIIWLHGLGADGHDFEPIVEELALPSIRFILPHAPVRPVSINNGYEMRAWYDIYGLGIDSPQDDAGIRAAQRQLEGLIDEQIALGIASKNIMLAGFSQGGAIALHTALRYHLPLAGVLALSTYLPLNATLMAEKHTNNQQIPIFLAHGTFDNVIQLSVAKHTASILKECGYQLESHEYAMAHSLCAQEVADIRQFIAKILK